MSQPKARVSQPYRDGDQERRSRDPRLEVEPVVLTRKYAQAIDGVDLIGREVGDRLPLERHHARLLIAEGWARPVPESQRRHYPNEERRHYSNEGRGQPRRDRID